MSLILEHWFFVLVLENLDFESGEYFKLFIFDFVNFTEAAFSYLGDELVFGEQDCILQKLLFKVHDFCELYLI